MTAAVPSATFGVPAIVSAPPSMPPTRPQPPGDCSQGKEQRARNAHLVKLTTRRMSLRAARKVWRARRALPGRVRWVLQEGLRLYVRQEILPDQGAAAHKAEQRAKRAARKVFLLDELSSMYAAWVADPASGLPAAEVARGKVENALRHTPGVTLCAMRCRH